MSDSDIRLSGQYTASLSYGLRPLEMLREPLDNLRLLGRRAILALLGIAVGCGAVIALLNIGYNVQLEAMSVFKGMGTDLLVTSMQPSMGSRDGELPTPADFNIVALRAALPEIQAVTASVLAISEVRVHGHGVDAVALGGGADLPSVLNLELAQGRFLSEFDAHGTYAVLGANVAAAWAAMGAAVSLGDRIQISGYLFQVVGILQKKGRNPLLPFSVDDAVLLPISGMRRVVSDPRITAIIARTQDDQLLAQTAHRLQSWLEEIMPNIEINVQIPRQLLEGMARQSRMFSWLLAGLGGISLLVGGVGVMNVMVMNVSERRREIGIRMALGARPRDIAYLFLLESVILSVVGALVGAVCGLGAAWLFVYFSGWSSFSLSVASILIGVGSAIIIGLFFGLSPALAAARLEPVQALRDA